MFLMLYRALRGLEGFPVLNDKSTHSSILLFIDKHLKIELCIS